MLMDIEPFSLVDYPGHIAATVFFAGCNFRCGFCHNPSLVLAKEEPQTSVAELIALLHDRKDLIEGVCLTGGEPSLSPDMPPLLPQIKEMGYKIKLDTNGTNLAQLIKIAPYLDYIAIDIKAEPEKYELLTNCPGSWAQVEKTIAWVKKCGLDYEFRTTVLPAWHNEDSLARIRQLLGNGVPWILQQFRQPPHGVLDGKNYESYSDAWLKELGRKLDCPVRGLN